MKHSVIRTCAVSIAILLGASVLPSVAAPVAPVGISAPSATGLAYKQVDLAPPMWEEKGPAVIDAVRPGICDGDMHLHPCYCLGLC